MMLALALPCHMHQQLIAENITDGQERAGRAGRAVVPNCGFCETRVLCSMVAGSSPKAVVRQPTPVGRRLTPP